ncbi:guanine deaminase [Chrysochromulina tobinii]|uniref:Guanine deaminase n=1 Tax=Chrysochromulina tobinii TaxID=1460289 RepID=A0A0M0JT47_9EUKA|nr:guanine deaminase [Chrysochromulina tobinii]|eukprot:KOO29363.1 guanine deaminase [Chrysochromulina sp. CCMP291]
MDVSQGVLAVFGTLVDAPRLGVVRGLDTPALIVISRTNGKIVSVQRDAEAASAAAALEARAAESRTVEFVRLGPREFLLPGFVDCHVHVAQWAYMGTGIDRPLMADDGFLAKYAFPAESSLNSRTAPSVYRAAVDDMLRHGTTTALVFGSARLDASEAYVATVLERGGPRSLVGKVNMDRYCPEGYVEATAQSLADTEAFIVGTKAANEALGLPAGSPPLVAPVVTPRFLPTCTPELLHGLGALAEKHDCFIQPGEAELMLLHGCAMAHCPTSNFFFAKEALPVRQLLQLGVKVGLGTDVAGGYSPSMLVAMRHAVLASKTLQFRRAKNCVFQCGPGADDGAAPPKRAKRPSNFSIEYDPTADADKLRDLHNLTHLDALHLATMAGADALGLGAHIGSFDVGKSFDAIVLAATPPAIRAFEGGVAEDTNDLLHKLLTLGDDRHVKAVFIGGKKIVSASPPAPPSIALEEVEKVIKKLVRPVKGFPNPDFVFGDITPLLADARAFGMVIDALVARYSRVDGLTAIASPEARGFFFGPAVAKALGVGFLPIRKMNQLPAETHRSEMVKMDYGERCMELHAGLLPSGGKGTVVIVDDILATGGSAIACAGILEQLGMTVHEVAAVFDYSDGASVLTGRSVLKDKGYSVFALARFCVEDKGSVTETMSWWLERGPDSDILISPHMGKMNKQH